VALRVLVVDDHAGFRRLARRLLMAGGYEVVGLAAGGADAMHQATMHQATLPREELTLQRLAELTL
jgi:CheY-like chemotaxis protein